MGINEAFDSGNKGKIFEDVSTNYEEISAAILMKEKYGNHLSGKTAREQLNNQFGGASRMVASSFERGEQYHGLGELCSYRVMSTYSSVL